MKRKGFTLAEVLITLTILGVVAAIAIPNLIRNYQKKALQTSFIKTVSTLQNALDLMVVDDGPGIYNRYAVYNRETGEYSGKDDPYFEKFYKYLNIYKNDKYRITKNIPKYKTFNNSGPVSTVPGGLCDEYRQFVYSHDSMIIYSQILSSQINIWVDTNGLKEPNRAGYDYFWFTVSRKDSLVGNTYTNANDCSKDNNSDSNGFACTHYALKNKCPWDATKKYWECINL